MFANDAWFNATVVGNNFNKEVRFWLNQRETAEYIAALADSFNNSICNFLQQFTEISKLDGESASSRAKLLNLIKQTGLVKTKTGSMKNGGGTWFHPKLAVAFARWLDVKFSIWCDMQIEKILHSVQYGLKQIPSIPAPRARTYIKGGLELHQQDAINDFIKERLENVPQKVCGSMKIKIYSAICTKFGTKGMDNGYKNIEPAHFDNIIQLIARLPLEENALVTLTKEDLDALVDTRVQEQIKALPTPEHNPDLINILTGRIKELEVKVVEGEVMPKLSGDQIITTKAALSKALRKTVGDTITVKANRELTFKVSDAAHDHDDRVFFEALSSMK